MLKNLRILYISLGVLILDQVTKLLVKGFDLPSIGLSHYGMNYGESIRVFGEWCKITYIENPHMAFGLEPFSKTFLTIFAFIASIAIVVLLWKHRDEKVLFRLSLALVLAGALGNLIDRTFHPLFYGSGGLFTGNVVDFVDFDLFTISLGSSSFKFWPIFNVADAAVSIGVVMLLISGFPQKAAKSQPAEKQTADSVSDLK